MYTHWSVLLLLCTFGSAKEEDTKDEFCTVDTKESCEGVVEEKVEEKVEEYSKQRWTDSADWSIRKELDEADELIGSEPKKAMSLFRCVCVYHLSECYVTATSCPHTRSLPELPTPWPGPAR